MGSTQLYNRNGPKGYRFGYTTRFLAVPVNGPKGVRLGSTNTLHRPLFITAKLYFEHQLITRETQSLGHRDDWQSFFAHTLLITMVRYGWVWFGMVGVVGDGWMVGWLNG